MMRAERGQVQETVVTLSCSVALRPLQALRRYDDRLDACRMQCTSADGDAQVQHLLQGLVLAAWPEEQSTGGMNSSGTRLG